MRFLSYGILLATFAAAAQAVPIVYVETGQLTGTLGANTFTNANFTFTLNGDTANITGPVSFLNPAVTNSFMIGAFTGSFTEAVDAADNNLGSIGLINPGGTKGVLFQSAAAVGYNLGGPISVSNAVAFAANGTYTTTLGNLVVTGAKNLTFTATGGSTATPEPGTIALSLTGLLALAGAAYRRNSRS